MSENAKMIFLYHEVAFRQHESNFLIRYILWKVVGKTHLVPITVLNACFPTTCMIKWYIHSTTKRKQSWWQIEKSLEDNATSIQETSKSTWGPKKIGIKHLIECWGFCRRSILLGQSGPSNPNWPKRSKIIWMAESGLTTWCPNIALKILWTPL